MVDNNINIQLSADTLDISKNYNFVLDEKCGGIDMFVGTVRRWNKDEEITHLDFECYEPMALSELKKIALLLKS